MSKQNDLQAMRRALIETMWLDYKLFGHRTQSVDALAKKIQKEKAGDKPAARVSSQITFGFARRKKAA